MSQCWTVTHTGIKPGIAFSGPTRGRHFVEIGAGYVRREPTDVLLKRQPDRVLFDKSEPPVLDGSRLTTACAKRRGESAYLMRARPDDKSALLFVDTSHTPCDSGSGWSIGTPDLVSVVAWGVDGHSLYMEPADDPHRQQVNRTTCYQKALVVLSPGGHLTVKFKVPGILTAEVTFNGDKPLFRIGQNVPEQEPDADLLYANRLFGTVPEDDGENLH